MFRELNTYNVRLFAALIWVVGYGLCNGAAMGLYSTRIILDKDAQLIMALSKQEKLDALYQVRFLSNMPVKDKSI
jgi:hypothetical protein